MSERDKKLLVYLGALVILAAAYFFVGRPFLDKIDALSTEKSQLESQLADKRKALENKDMYEQGIVDSEARLQEIIDEFPADNSDEKSIMFVANAEPEIPIWFNQVRFAEETKMMINGEEVESASDVEQTQLEENVEAAEGEEVPDAEDIEAPESESGRGSTGLGDLMYRDTELGLTFETTYDGFKKLLSYIRDYEDRMVIKEIDISYAKAPGLVSGTLVLSQYAILGPGRELPDIVTDVEDLGSENIFLNRNNGGSIIDLAKELASDLIKRIIGEGSGRFEMETEPDFFVKVNAVTDNTSGKTVGKTDDLQQSSYVLSDENSDEDVRFEVSGNGGHYTVRYSIGDNSHEETIDKEADKPLHIRVISTERMSDSDKVSVSLHVINNSDLQVTVAVEGEDENKPRVDVVEKVGDVTVK